MHNTVSVHQMVIRYLEGIRRIGSPEQQREVDELRRLLERHYAQPEAVNFARVESPAQNPHASKNGATK